MIEYVQRSGWKDLKKYIITVKLQDSNTLCATCSSSALVLFDLALAALTLRRTRLSGVSCSAARTRPRW